MLVATALVLTAGPATAQTDAGPPSSSAADAQSISLDGGSATPDAGATGSATDAGVGLDGGAATATPPARPPGHASAPETESAPAGMLLRTLVALLACLALAYLAGHPRVQELEERLGISQVVTAGFPFFALGAIAHLPSVGLLPDAVVHDLSPLLELGLGWIGLLAGLQFDVRVAETWPKRTGDLASVLTFVPFAIIAGTIGLLLYLLAIPVSTERLLRDAAMFGAAGCLAAPTATTLLASSGLSERAAHVVRTVAVVDDAAGVLLLALLSAFHRPDRGHAWELPGIGWLFVTLGMGIALGGLAYALLRIARTPAESTALLLGSIALASGMGTVFSVSPIVIGFMAGVVLTNLPGTHHETMRAPLARFERPIYLLFLLVAGALWRFDMWQGWLLLPAFVLARLLGRMAAARIARARGLLDEMPQEQGAVSRAFVSAPIGALSIAIVVNVQTLYPGRAVPLMVTAIVGGALVSEMLVQITARRSRARPAPLEPEVHDAEEPT